MTKSDLQVHPYANMAWSILSAAQKVCLPYKSILSSLRFPVVAERFGAGQSGQLHYSPG
jgi:hypothetical protein